MVFPEAKKTRAVAGLETVGIMRGDRAVVVVRIKQRQIPQEGFGLAQRRRRVFVIASVRDGFDPTEVLFEREGMRQNIAPGRGARRYRNSSFRPTTDVYAS